MGGFSRSVGPGKDDHARACFPGFGLGHAAYSLIFTPFQGGGLMVAEGYLLALEHVRGEVLVTFHQHGVVTLGDDDVVPGDFHV